MGIEPEYKYKILGKYPIFRGQFAYGEGIENYMNECPADIGIKENPGHPEQPVLGVPFPVTGIVAFIDQNWNEKFSSMPDARMLISRTLKPLLQILLRQANMQ